MGETGALTPMAPQPQPLPTGSNPKGPLIRRGSQQQVSISRSMSSPQFSEDLEIHLSWSKIGRGVNVSLVEEDETVPLIELTYNEQNVKGRFYCPDQVSVYSNQDTGSYEDETCFDSWKKIAVHHAKSVGAKASLTGLFEAKAKAQWDNYESSSSGLFVAINSLVIKIDEAQCLLDKARLSLTAEFSQALASLPYEYEDETKDIFFKFFERFGTHFISGFDFGGKRMITHEVRTVGKLTSEVASGLIKLTTSKQLAIMSATGSISSSLSKSKKFRLMIQNKNTTLSYKGGASSTHQQLSNYNPEKDDEWKHDDNLRNNPVPTSRHLKEISVLCSEEAKRQAIHNALVGYSAMKSERDPEFWSSLREIGTRPIKNLQKNLINRVASYNEKQHKKSFK